MLKAPVCWLVPLAFCELYRLSSLELLGNIIFLLPQKCKILLVRTEHRLLAVFLLFGWGLLDAGRSMQLSIAPGSPSVLVPFVSFGNFTDKIAKRFSAEQLLLFWLVLPYNLELLMTNITFRIFSTKSSVTRVLWEICQARRCRRSWGGKIERRGAERGWLCFERRRGCRQSRSLGTVYRTGRKKEIVFICTWLSASGEWNP